MIKDDTTPDAAGATTEVTITDGLTRDVFGFKTGTMLDNTEVRVITDSLTSLYPLFELKKRMKENEMD